MKKSIFLAILLLFVNLPSYSYGDFVVVQSDPINNGDESSYTMETIWTKNGKYEEKVINVGAKLLYDNGINRRIPFRVQRTKEVNAYSSGFDKVVNVYQGLFPYIDNDDELAYVVGHEISHSLDAYRGVPYFIASFFNSKRYESKSDLMAIDMMVKSGYNPVAAITCANKWMGEPLWDFGASHPKTSKRLLAMYKYISVKYPQSLNSPMASNVHFVNFKRSADRDIKEFEQKRAEKAYKKKHMNEKSKL